MSIILRQSELEECIRDPAFGAWMLTGVELDTFQSAALKVMWFTKETIDSSAVNTGKTYRMLLWCVMRAVFLPNPPGSENPGRLIGAFFQEKGSVDEIFVKEMDRMIALPGAKLLRRELKRQVRGRLGYHATENTINYHFRNGAIISAPTLNVMRQAKTLAGRRYSDGWVDEFTQIDQDAEALDEQLLSRINRVDYNPKHPVWSPHIVLTAHAEDPDSHPSAARIRQFKELIRGGSQDHALITSSSRDWNPENGKLFADKREAALKERRRDALKKGRAKVLQMHDGIWAPGGSDWYDGESRKRCLQAELKPESKPTPGALYALGWDTASSGGEKADWNAGVVWRALRVDPRMLGQVGVMPLDDGRCFHLAPVAATAAIDRSGPECSGIIHTLDRMLGLSRVVMDGGGGGQMVKKELWRPVQLIRGVATQGVIGMCEWGMEHQYAGARGIIQEFKPTAPRLLHVWEDGFTKGMDGIVDGMHRKMRDAFETQTVAWPETADRRGQPGLQGWTRIELEMLTWLDMAYGQFGSIRFRTEKDGRPKMTSNSFHSFEAKGKRKKDLAYAALYGFIAILSLITDPEVIWDGEAEDGACYD